MRRGWRLTKRNGHPASLGELSSIIDAEEGMDGVVFGNGPSYAYYSPDRITSFIDGKVSIGCNQMWECWGKGTPDIPCKYYVILDATFMRRYSAELVRYYDKYKPTFLLSARQVGTDLPFVALRINSGITPKNKPPYRPASLFHVGSGGVIACQVALHLGLRTIYMLGHDCKPNPNGGQTHGHGDRRRHKGYSQGAGFVVGYEYLPVWAKQQGRGAEFVNLSPYSTFNGIRNDVPPDPCACDQGRLLHPARDIDSEICGDPVEVPHR